MVAFNQDLYFDLAPPERRGIGRYILGAILILVLWLLLATIPIILLMAVGVNAPIELIQSGASWVDISSDQDSDALVACAFILYSVIVMLLATIIVGKFLHRQPLRTLFTARAKFDMSRFWKGGLAIFILNVVIFTIGYLMASEDYVVTFDAARMAPFVVLVLLLTPFQCLAEEVFFRGYLTQGISALTGSLVVRLGVPALLFMVFHAANGDWASGGIWAPLTYLTLALYLGLLTYQSNGLEVATGFHTFHNILAFTLVTSGGAGMPFATAFYVEKSDYMASFLVSLPIMLMHYLICRRLGLFEAKSLEGVDQPAA